MSYQLLITFEAKEDLKNMLLAIEEAIENGNNEGMIKAERDPVIPAAERRDPDVLPDLVKHARGEALADLFHMRPDDSDHAGADTRYMLGLGYGTKTAVGIFNTVTRIINAPAE